MTTITIRSRGRIASEIGKVIADRIEAARLDQVLVANARRRIRNSGDSEIRYETLWMTRNNLGYRAGGVPLRDTGILMNSITGRTTRQDNDIALSLVDSTPGSYAILQNDGFTNPPPIVIPLTRRATRMVPARSPHDLDSLVPRLLNAGMIEGPLDDFIISLTETTVPARPIARMPPEDVQSMTRALVRAIESVN